jgi:hypothetical protein
MRHSAAILITLATIPVIPIVVLAGVLVGIAVAIEFLFLWLTFVWEEM